MFGASMSEKDWTWATLWGVSILIDVYELYRAINVHNGRYRKLLSASMAQTAITVLALAGVVYNLHNSKWLLVAAWLPLLAFSGRLVYKQHKMYKREVALDAKIDAFMTKHFPADKMGDIKLERK